MPLLRDAAMPRRRRLLMPSRLCYLPRRRCYVCRCRDDDARRAAAADAALLMLDMLFAHVLHFRRCCYYGYAICRCR